MPERAFDTRTPNAKAAAENRVVSTLRLYRLEAIRGALLFVSLRDLDARPGSGDIELR